MLSSIAAWVLAIICVEAVTEILTTAEIFSKPRNWLQEKSSFAGGLISCGYCFSVWISAAIGWALPGQIFQIVVADAIIKTFVLHRLSNAYHEGMSRWLGRYPWVLSISNTVDVDNDDIIEVPEDEDGEE
jgi:hypothetical protein